MSTPMIRLWYAVTALVMSCVVIAAVSVQYANWTRQETIRETQRQQRESERRWCALLSTLVDAYSAQPPRSPAGVAVAERVTELHRQFGCD